MLVETIYTGIKICALASVCAYGWLRVQQERKAETAKEQAEKTTWGPLMLLALSAAWTLLIFGAWKITTIAKHITKRYYEKFICKIFMNNKNEK